MIELKYNEQGLIPVIAQDADNGEVLMMAWMNAEAFQRTCDTRKATYWSRSRKSFWVKGETSGHTQEVQSMYYDCDKDTLLLKIRQVGAACHRGYRSCFFTEIGFDGKSVVHGSPLKNPEDMYKNTHP